MKILIVNTNEIHLMSLFLARFVINLIDKNKLQLRLFLPVYFHIFKMFFFMERCSGPFKKLPRILDLLFLIISVLLNKSLKSFMFFWKFLKAAGLWSNTGSI